MAFSLIEKTQSKVIQSGGLACLTKIIINCPDDILYEKLDALTDRLGAIFKNKQFQAH